MKTFARAIIPAALLLLALRLNAQQPFPVTSTVNEPSIAGRAVALDAKAKLLPWPIPEDTGYSYSSYFLAVDNRLGSIQSPRLPYFYCCFDFDRATFEMIPDEHWVNSTGYLRAV